MDKSELRDVTLRQLHDMKIFLTSPEWNAKVQASTAAERQKASLVLLKLQQVSLAMENAELEDLAEKLKANEKALRAGQAAVRSACEKVSTVQPVLKAVSALLKTAAKIIALL